MPDQNRRQRANLKIAQDLKASAPLGSPAVQASITITTDLKNESFSVDISTFCFAEAEGNYIDLYYLEEEVLKRHTYRIRLSAFESQLATDSLVRCHRSFVVNLAQVTKVSGNAQGLTLHFANTEATVPVSRKYLHTVKAYFDRQ